MVREKKILPPVYLAAAGAAVSLYGYAFGLLSIRGCVILAFLSLVALCAASCSRQFIFSNTATNRAYRAYRAYKTYHGRRDRLCDWHSLRSAFRYASCHRERDADHPCAAFACEGGDRNAHPGSVALRAALLSRATEARLGRRFQRACRNSKRGLRRRHTRFARSRIVSRFFPCIARQFNQLCAGTQTQAYGYVRTRNRRFN